jgi:Zn-dependent protease with chaperone function
MTQKEFETLVKRLEPFAQRRPGLYALRVGMVAGLGYAFLLLALLVLLGLLAVLVLVARQAAYLAIKVAIPLLALMGAILRSLWVKIPEPEGVPLKPAEVPALFQTVGALGKTLRAPKLHSVLLTLEFNAGISHRPRLGVLGWPKRYLLLGLPLLQALTPEQFRAVLAHEFGHLSGNHGHFASWIYRTRQTWTHLLENLQSQKRWGTGLFVRFSKWYAPWFNAYSFVLARAHEYEADRAAAEVTSGREIAEALVAINLKNRLLQGSFWPGVWKAVTEQRDPPADVLSDSSHALAGPFECGVALKWVREGLSTKTNYFDTHPCLADRLAALGYPLDSLRNLGEGETWGFSSAVGETAAQRFLGAALPRLTSTLNRDWQKAVTPRWRDTYDEFRQARQRLQNLEERAASQPLATDEAGVRALLTLKVKGTEAAYPLLLEYLAERPNSVAANHFLGEILLERGEAAGVTHLEKAAALDPSLGFQIFCRLSDFFFSRNEMPQAQEYRQRAGKHQELLQRAQKEREKVTVRDRFEAHQVPQEFLPPLCEMLGWFGQVERAYLVRKAVAYFPDHPWFVLGVVRRRRWLERNAKREYRDLAQTIAKRVKLPGSCLVLAFSGSSPWRKVLGKIPGAEIYRAPRGGKR